MNDDSYININEQGSKHLLSLDALDLSLLPTTYRPWFMEKPGFLWRHNTFFPDGKDYFEFVIKPKVGSGDDAQETSNSICHICNTVVPRAYVSEHINSSKHISYQKIAEVGLGRARKHKQMTRIEGMKNSLEYFCEHCVSVIHLSNRNEHEKSKTHKNFAALDIFLNNFALFYTNEETIDIIDSQIHQSEQDNLNVDISLLKVNAKVSEDINVKETVNNDSKTLKIKDNNESNSVVFGKGTLTLEKKLKSSVVLINAIESCLNNAHEEMNNNVTEVNKYEEANIVKCLDQYIKRLKMYGTVKLHTINSFNQDCLRIETSSGFELVVSTFNFHGFKKVGKNLQCKLCKSFIKNVTEHIVLERHMKIVSQAFEDKHCIRRLQDSFSHCVVCNEVIDNTTIHTQFNKHVRKLEHALAPTNTNENSSPMTIPEITKLAINFTHADKNILELSKLENLNKSGEASHNINLSVDNTAGNIKTIKNISDNQHYCITCDTQMHVNNVDTHLAGMKHTMNSKLVIYYLMSKGKNNLLSCKVCHTNIINYTWAVEDHVMSTDHLEKYNNCLGMNKIDKIKGSFFCKPCGKGLAKTTELSHIENQSHKVKLASYNITSIDENNRVKEIENGHVDVNDNDETILMKTTVNETLNGADIHVGSFEKHCTKLYEDKDTDYQNIKDNKLKHEKTNTLFDNRGKLMCEITKHKNIVNPVDRTLSGCDTSFKDISNNSSNIKTHNNNIKRKAMDVLLTGVNKMLEELLEYSHSPPAIHSHLQLTDAENVLNCIVCCDNISVDETEKHTNSLKHIHHHRDLLTTNKLKFKNDNYVCYACNVYVDIGQELRHIKTAEHGKQIESLKNGDYVLITANNKTLIARISQDLKATESKIDAAKSKELTFGDFIPNINKVTTEIANLRHHFCELIDNEKQVICLLCQELVENTESQYQIHLNYIDHKMNYKTLTTYNQIFKIENGFVCGFCECIIDGNEFAHISSEKHISSRNSDSKKNFCYTCKVSTIDLDLREHITSKSHIKNISTPTHFYCNICNLQITNNDINIQMHNNGFQHQNNSILIDENKVLLKNKRCFCQVCETTFSRDGLESHISSTNHIMLRY